MIEFTPSQRVRFYAATFLEEVDHTRYLPLADNLQRHPDDLPEGWQDESGNTRDAAHPLRRAWNRSDNALYEFKTALYVAGFTHEEIAIIVDSTRIADLLESVLTGMWDYRRMGFPVSDALVWRAMHIRPYLARVYADAGYKPQDARRLEKWLDKAAGRTTNRHLVPNWRARVTLLILDHQTSRERAVDYVMAGVQHDEVRDWEKRRRAGEDVRAALIALRALAGR